MNKNDQWAFWTLVDPCIINLRLSHVPWLQGSERIAPRYCESSSPSATQERSAPSNACNRRLRIPPREGFAVSGPRFSSHHVLGRFRTSFGHCPFGFFWESTATLKMLTPFFLISIPGEPSPSTHRSAYCRGICAPARRYAKSLIKRLRRLRGPGREGGEFKHRHASWRL
jgi:hypothetical protein